ncbi:MAG TPA: PIG-L deacetylase family protein [Streptosporangiaceae bacterium]|jgi:LmbE family N-acetylglucosaminyl deacetylase
MTPSDGYTRILVAMAHPDDVDYGAAGTVALWTRAGVEVVYCVVTDGAAGSEDPLADREALAALRREEQLVAARIAGVARVTFLGYPDGAVQPDLGLRRDLSRVIRTVRPDLVVTHSPERNLVRVKASHPDHRAVGAAVLDAVYPDARNPSAYPELITREGLAAWTVPEVWMRGGPVSDRYVEISETFAVKMAAIRAHRSQGELDPEFDEVMRGRLAAIAQAAGLPAGSIAEAFQMVDSS